MRASAKQTEAFERLVRSADGSVLQEFLTAHLTETLNQLTEAQADTVQRLQGRAQTVKELLKLFGA